MPFTQGFSFLPRVSEAFTPINTFNTYIQTKSKEKKQARKNQEEDLYSQLYSIRREEEEKWRIKSRKVWMKSGDRNTSFFHKQATVRQIMSNITKIIDSEGN